MRRNRVFEPPIAQPLNEGIALLLAGRNALIAAAPDDHFAEALVQAAIVELLTARLPSADLISNNVLVIDSPELGRCIPDLVIHNIGRGIWGIFEIKTLLKGDHLGVPEVSRDLEKLCAYKAKHPNAAAVFVLVGSRSKLFNSQRVAAWSDLRISYDHDSFDGGQMKQQAVNDEFVAIPCGSFNHEIFPIACFMWEIQPRDTPLRTLSSYFRFRASMA